MNWEFVPSIVVLGVWNHKKRGLVQGLCITREATLQACLLDVDAGDVMLSLVQALLLDCTIRWHSQGEALTKAYNMPSGLSALTTVS